MKLYITTFANEKYRSQQEFLKNYCKQFSFANLKFYDEKFLENSGFIEENKELFSYPRGFGYWVWKPYILLKTLETMEDNDVVFYLDCGDFFRKEVFDYVSKIIYKEDCLLLGNIIGNINKQWTKRDCFQYMDCDTPEFTDGIQVEAGVQIWKKTKKTVDVLNEYLRFCKDIRIVSDNPNVSGLENYDGFKDHRHDQSILTNLRIKHKLPVDCKFVDTQYRHLGNFFHFNVL